jgi:hypothetical protein
MIATSLVILRWLLSEVRYGGILMLKASQIVLLRRMRRNG